MGFRGVEKDRNENSSSLSEKCRIVRRSRFLSHTGHREQREASVRVSTFEVARKYLQQSYKVTREGTDFI